MADVSLDAELSGDQFALFGQHASNEQRAAHQPSRPRAGSHWTSRLADPLGNALRRLMLPDAAQPANSPSHASFPTASAASATPLAGASDLPQTTAIPLETGTPKEADRAGVNASLDGGVPGSTIAEQLQSDDDQTGLKGNGPLEKEPEEPFPATIPLTSAGAGKIPESHELPERRRFPRRKSTCRVSVIDRDQVDTFKPREVDWMLQSSRTVGQLLDISQSGLCLLTDREISVGSEVLLRITNQEVQRTVDNSATVVHCQQSGLSRYSIHCRVLHDFSLDQLQDLGRPVLTEHVLA